MKNKIKTCEINLTEFLVLNENRVENRGENLFEVNFDKFWFRLFRFF